MWCWCSTYICIKALYVFLFSAAYLLNTRGCPILRLNLDIKYLWWPVQLGCHSWNMFSKYGCGCAGQLELLAYAIVRDILMLITAIYTPLSEVKSMFFKMFRVLWREHLKDFYLEDRGSMFLKIWYWHGVGRWENTIWILNVMLCALPDGQDSKRMMLHLIRLPLLPSSK